MKKSGKSEEYILNEREFTQLWSVCQDPSDKVLVGTMLFDGLRVGESTHLNRDWVKEDKIHIPSTMPCECWGCRLRGYWKPKSKAGIRIIPIPGFLKPILLEYLHDKPAGLDFNRMSAWARVQNLSKEAKTPRIFPHALRATCATILASKGFTAIELCYFMGWARLEMGEHYIRISEARQGVEDKMKDLWPDK